MRAFPDARATGATFPTRVARCQIDDSIYAFRRPFGTAWRVKRAAIRARDDRAPGPPRGWASRFLEGDWVRVKGAEEIRATLGGGNKLRGLLFTDVQWAYCGGTYRVDRVLRRILVSGRRFRGVDRTVSLEGVTCDGPDGANGCGHACSLYFRDEWLEPSAEKLHAPSTPARWARVRPWAEIRATLDRRGRLDGVSTMPEMERFAGMRLPVARRVEDVGIELPWWYKGGTAEVYVLAGARCGGAAFAATGGCDRNCGIMWHRAWLELEELDPAQADPA